MILTEACLACAEDYFVEEMGEKLPLTSQEDALVKLDVTIVGAGLGGLATAIALTRRGHRVTMYEAAPEIAEIGAGIQGWWPILFDWNLY